LYPSPRRLLFTFLAPIQRKKLLFPLSPKAAPSSPDAQWNLPVFKPWALVDQAILASGGEMAGRASWNFLIIAPVLGIGVFPYRAYSINLAEKL
jgi:hypothetical protein